MAKRLSKALRGKRRWLGILVEHHITNREQLEKVLSEIGTEFFLKKPIRLMDFKNSDQYKESEKVKQFLNDREMPNDVGAAIIEVQLEDYDDVRNLISESDFFYHKGALSFTTSGKIRLVRQRIFG